MWKSTRYTIITILHLIVFVYKAVPERLFVQVGKFKCYLLGNTLILLEILMKNVMNNKLV